MDEVAARDYLEEGAEAARGYQNAEKVAVDFLKRVCAQPISAALNKEERTERKIEIKGAAASSSSPFVEEPAEAEYCEEENPPPPSPPVSQFIQPPPEPDIAEVTAALSSYERPDGETVEQIIKAVRERQREATGADIVGVIHQLGQLWRGPGLGLFVKHVHLKFPLPRGSAVQARKLPTRRMTAQEAKAEAEREEFMRRTLDDMAYAQQQREREQQEQAEKQEQELRQLERDRQIREKVAGLRSRFALLG